MNTTRRITAVAILALLTFCIWSTSSQSRDERYRSLGESTSTAQNPTRAMRAEEKLVRDVYARLMRYQSAGRDELAAASGSINQPADYLTFNLHRIHTGPISEIHSRQLTELVTSRAGDAFSVKPFYLDFNGGPPHVYYDVAWIKALANSDDIRWLTTGMTVGQWLPEAGPQFADIEKYTSYEVTARLDGKQRRYRALVLHHTKSPGAIREVAEILDHVTVELNTVLRDQSPAVHAPWSDYVKSPLYRTIAKSIRETLAAGKPLRSDSAPIGYLPGDDVTTSAMMIDPDGGDGGGGGGGDGDGDPLPPPPPPPDPCAPPPAIRIVSPNAVSQGNAQGFVDGTTQRGMLGATVPLRAVVSGSTGGTYEWKIGDNVVGGNSATLDAVITTLGNHTISVKYDSGDVHLQASLTLTEVVPELDTTSDNKATFFGDQTSPFVTQGHNCVDSLVNPAWYLLTACTLGTAVAGMDISAFIKDPRPFISNVGESKLKLVQIVNEDLRRTNATTGTCEILKTTGWMLDGADPYHSSAVGGIEVSSEAIVKMNDSPQMRLATGFHFNLTDNFEVYLVYFTGTVQNPMNQKAIGRLEWSWGGRTQYNASNSTHSEVSGTLSPPDDKRTNGVKLTPNNDGTGIRAFDKTPIQSIDVNNQTSWKPCT